jgi:hypothetical protein
VCREYDRDKNTPFALKFFVANYAGYGLFEECIVDLKDLPVK